jgi:hypothetical protein
MNISASKVTEVLAVVQFIPPQSTSTTIVSTYFKADKCIQYAAIISVGALGSSTTVDASWLQGDSSAGANPKAITGASAITQLTQAGTDANKVVILNLRPEMMDHATGFYWAALSITAGTSTALVSVVIVGLGVKDGPATNANISTVDELAN